MTLQQLIIESRNSRLINQNVEVIVDEVKGGTALARTRYDAYEVDNTTRIENCANLQPGDLVKVRIIEADAYDFKAEITA
jgi:ribosomal protein S12 methylthiotransferase